MSEKAKPGLKFWLVVIFSLAAGLTILWNDTRAGWDDTGITAGLIFISSMIAGLLYPRKVWLWALLIGIWIPMVNIIKDSDIRFLIILIIPFAGAYAGGLICRVIDRVRRNITN